MWMTGQGDPALVCVPIPFDPALIGMQCCVQGLALQVLNCFGATDVVEVNLRLP
jgi:hypothetical protein